MLRRHRRAQRLEQERRLDTGLPRVIRAGPCREVATAADVATAHVGHLPRWQAARSATRATRPTWTRNDSPAACAGTRGDRSCAPIGTARRRNWDTGRDPGLGSSGRRVARAEECARRDAARPARVRSAARARHQWVVAVLRQTARHAAAPSSTFRWPRWRMPPTPTPEARVPRAWRHRGRRARRQTPPAARRAVGSPPRGTSSKRASRRPSCGARRAGGMPRGSTRPKASCGSPLLNIARNAGTRVSSVVAIATRQCSRSRPRRRPSPAGRRPAGGAVRPASVGNASRSHAARSPIARSAGARSVRRVPRQPHPRQRVDEASRDGS